MLEISSPSKQFKIKDAGSYDAVTDEFDFFTQTLSHPFAARMIGLANLRASDRVLDVGTGTGIVAFNAARKLHNGSVVAIDLSEGMLKTAQHKRTTEAAGSRIEFRRMDAEALEFSNESFDVVLSLFALMHFPNPFTALNEMFRVLKPGGRLVLAVGGPPRLLSMAAVVEAFRRVRQIVLQRTGKLLVAPAFLDGLVNKHMPGTHTETSELARAGVHRADNVTLLVKKAGFTDIRTSWSGHRAVLNTAEEYWRIQSTFSSLARKRLADAEPEKLQNLRTEFLAECEVVKRRNGQFVYPMGAFFVSAAVPSR